MQIAIVTSEDLKEELLSNELDSTANIVWMEELGQLKTCPGADVVIDLVFDLSHLPVLRSLQNAMVIINSVDMTLAETDEAFVRINGWPSFLKSPVIEASCLKEEPRIKTTEIFSLFHKKIEWLPDTVGFVTPRVISMIINEAFIALEEGVSTPEEINTAMKLGTNYPYGPFDWAAKIGIQRVNELLLKLSPDYVDR
jgi:3-hydroxybutyryl-CoA dehydrogenase